MRIHSTVKHIGLAGLVLALATPCAASSASPAAAQPASPTAHVNYEFSGQLKMANTDLCLGFSALKPAAGVKQMDCDTAHTWEVTDTNDDSEPTDVQFKASDTNLCGQWGYATGDMIVFLARPCDAANEKQHMKLRRITRSTVLVETVWAPGYCMITTGTGSRPVTLADCDENDPNQVVTTAY